MSLALVRNCSADVVGIEDPIFGASCADSGFPGVASSVRDRLRRSDFTDSVVEGESAVASSAGSVGVVRSAEG